MRAGRKAVCFNLKTILSITNNLSFCTTNNSLKELIKGESYSATISASYGYELTDVTVMMDGEDVTGYVYYEGEIYIEKVTGNLVISATASVIYFTITNDLSESTNSNSLTRIAMGSSYSATITANEGYEITELYVSMGGEDITATDGEIYIEKVTDDIYITAVTEKLPDRYIVFNYGEGDFYFGDVTYYDVNAYIHELTAWEDGDAITLTGKSSGMSMDENEYLEIAADYNGYFSDGYQYLIEGEFEKICIEAYRTGTTNPTFTFAIQAPGKTEQVVETVSISSTTAQRYELYIDPNNIRYGKIKFETVTRCGDFVINKIWFEGGVE